MPRSRVSVKFFVKICFRLYERRASPLWRDLTIDYPRSRLGELEIFHIKLRGLRTHDKGCLDQHFLDNISQACLCVGYEMKTCTQISDVVSPGESAKRASPGRRAGFSHVNAR